MSFGSVITFVKNMLVLGSPLVRCSYFSLVTSYRRENIAEWRLSRRVVAKNSEEESVTHLRPDQRRTNCQWACGDISPMPPHAYRIRAYGSSEASTSSTETFRALYHQRIATRRFLEMKNSWLQRGLCRWRPTWRRVSARKWCTSRRRCVHRLTS